jgi:MFS family permease
MLSIFMAAVEVTIVSRAMPTIVSELGGFRLFSWVFAVYLLAQAVSTPLYGLGIGAMETANLVSDQVDSRHARCVDS